MPIARAVVATAGSPSGTAEIARATAVCSIMSGGTGIATIALVIQFAVPMRANTAPKILEVTARSSTMLEVVMALMHACLSPA